MKAAKEIAMKFEEENKKSASNWPDVLVGYIPYEQAKALGLVKVGGDARDWKFKKLVEKTVVDEMKAFVDFALPKVAAHTSLAAMRGMDKLRAWTWLIDKDTEIAWENFPNFGAPVLKQICEKFEFGWPAHPVLNQMAKGLPCSPECVRGCNPVG